MKRFPKLTLCKLLNSDKSVLCWITVYLILFMTGSLSNGQSVRKWSGRPRFNPLDQGAKNGQYSSHLDWQIFESHRRLYARQRVGERVKIQFILPTLTHRGGSVIVWEAFANYKVENLHQVKGKLNRTGYRSILQHHVIPCETRLVVQRFCTHAT